MCSPGGIVDFVNGSFYATPGLHPCANPDEGCQNFQQMFGSSGEDRVSHEGSRNAVRDSVGNIFVAGNTYGSLDPLVSNEGGSDVFVTKVDPDGAKLWTRMLGGAGDDHSDDMTIDDAGNVFVALRMARTDDFGFDATFGQVIKLDGQGTKMWYKDIGSQAVHGRLSLSAAAGALYVAGTTDMGFSQVWKYDLEDGAPLWATPLDLGLKVYEGPRGIAVTGTGDGYVTGFARSSVDSQDYIQGDDVFLIKFDHLGQKVWTRMFGSEANDLVKGIAVDPFGNVYLTGHFGFEDAPTSFVSFSGAASVSNGDYDAFLVKYSASAEMLWAKVLGTSRDNRGQSVDTDEHGNVYVAGVSEDALPGSKHIGNYDLFVSIFDPSGAHVSTKMFGSAEIEDNAGVCASVDGITVVGSTAGVLDGLFSAGDWDVMIVSYLPSCAKLSDGLDLLCPPGYYCPPGVVNLGDHGCPRGTFSNHSGLSNIAQCHSCPPGMYCGDVGLTAPSGVCSEGVFCTRGVADALATLCDSRTLECDSGGCENLAIRTPGVCGGTCPAGSYCPLGSSAPIPCPPGFYCDIDGLHEISGPCDAGYFCAGYGSSNARKEICPQGSYCPEGSDTPTKCPKGSSSDAEGYKTVSDCIQCPAGFFCPEAADSGCIGDAATCLGAEEPCPAGYYCPAGSYRGTDPEHICPRGHFCLQGSPVPSPCPPSQYQNEYGKTECKLCMEGSFCPGVAVFDVLLTPPAFTDRPDGGAVMCTPGGYCHAGLPSPLLCDRGYYNPRNGSTNVSDCLQCPSGYHCNVTGLGAPSGPCAPGYYCLPGQQRRDPPSTVCPKGHYCPEGSSWPRICRAGTYSSSFGAALCTLVRPGHYSTAVGLVTLGLETYVRNSTTNGTVLTSVDFEMSKMICAGDGDFRICEAVTSAIFGICDSGYYCSGGSSTPKPLAGSGTRYGDICPAGHYCPKGTNASILCEAGRYQPGIGQFDCLEVPKGYYAESSRISLLECPKGFYCPAGDGHTPIACPRGTFGNLTKLSQRSQCFACPPGMYCGSEGIDEPTGYCKAGFICAGGDVVPAPATSRDLQGSGPCPRGNFCPEGSTKAYPCPPGTFNSLQKSGNISDCLACRPGYYCPDPGLVVGDDVTKKCSAGFYCPSPAEEKNVIEILSSFRKPGAYATPSDVAIADARRSRITAVIHRGLVHIMLRGCDEMVDLCQGKILSVESLL